MLLLLSFFFSVFLVVGLTEHPLRAFIVPGCRLVVVSNLEAAKAGTNRMRFVDSQAANRTVGKHVGKQQHRSKQTQKQTERALIPVDKRLSLQTNHHIDSHRTQQENF